MLLELRGQRVVVLASGDPFWFGVGSVLARELAEEEWIAHPGASTFALAVARLGWPLEQVLCRGLHAAPVERLRTDIAPGVRVIATLRDGEALVPLAGWLSAIGFGETVLHVMESLGGPRERIRRARASDYSLSDVAHPVAVALEFAGDGRAFHKASGQQDEMFDSDGQMTKRPIRAATLSALAPMPGETLWDIGAGSGSISLEWLLSDPSTQAIAVESRADRVENIRRNARKMGLDRLNIVEGRAPAVLAELPRPQAVFVGGGLSAELLGWLEGNLPAGTRLVVNSVTLETEALLVEAAGRLGGSLLKLSMAEAQPIGGYRGWKSAYPVVQWSVTL